MKLVNKKNPPKFAKLILWVITSKDNYSAIFGDYPFFFAPTIGGLQTLRGFRRNRFSGDYSFYQNTELRIRLFTLQSEFLISDIGILALHDIGRVWTDNATPLQNIYTSEEIAEYSSDDKWHRGIGFGIWLAPFNMAVVSADYSFNNNNDSSLFLRLGFLF